MHWPKIPYGNAIYTSSWTQLEHCHNYFILKGESFLPIDICVPKSLKQSFRKIKGRRCILSALPTENTINPWFLDNGF